MTLLTLINTNRMRPPIAPVGLDYIASAVQAAGIQIGWIDLCLAEDAESELDRYFVSHRPDLVGLTLRNVDGEQALIQLLDQISGGRCWELVDGLLFKRDGQVSANPPAWPRRVSVSSQRNLVDNATYFRLGGQIGVETKRGCRRRCIYCADPVAKGRSYRCRPGNGPVDLLQPVFYLSRYLGDQPARLVRELIGDDPRFFPPEEHIDRSIVNQMGDHNYSHNKCLMDAISTGCRGAYWDILREGGRTRR